MARRKHRPFTILEILISLALIGTLFFFLTFNLKNLVITKARIAPTKEHILHKTQISLKLRKIFSNLNPASPVFFTHQDRTTSQKYLRFKFFNDVDIDPLFSGEIEGILHLSKDKKFVLSLKGKEEAQEQYVLYPLIETVRFHFFDDKEKKWLADWSKDCEYLPNLIKISLNLKGETETFCFITNAAMELTITP